MTHLSIDLETFSAADLPSCGVYRYAEDPSFLILLFGCSVDYGPVRVYDLASGESLPPEILWALLDDSIIKTAFNAAFERVCLSRYLRDRDLLPPGTFLSPHSWRCTMVWSAALGLPMSLKGVGEALGLEKQKLDTGKDLIKFFCTPAKPSLLNGLSTRNPPSSNPEKWMAFKAYNARDVETELEIQKKLSSCPLSDALWREYALDQKINDKGIGLDLPLVRSALAIDAASHNDLMNELIRLTGLENPASVMQFRRWLEGKGVQVDSLDKKQSATLLKTVPEDLREPLILRSQLAKSSVRKYQAMDNAACRDCRARGMFMFHGASRTGRFSGRLIQIQNLPRNMMKDLDAARSLVRSGDLDSLRMLYPDIPDTLSQLVRTAFVPPEGKRFIVADFSAIEARVLAWLAGETWRSEVFSSGGDIYCASASAMFHVPVEKHGVNGHLRQKGKIAELALGYGGSTGALISMGALDMGLQEEELLPLVQAWRNANPAIVAYWQAVGESAFEAVTTGHPVSLGNLNFHTKPGVLFITLPSGRFLSYVRPKIGQSEFGTPELFYMGNAGRKWIRQSTYGPKLVENIVQAISRDILLYAMKNLDADGWPIVAHVHDEVIIEADPDTDPAVICNRMSKTPPWAAGLLLKAEGDSLPYYMKS